VLQHYVDSILFLRKLTAHNNQFDPDGHKNRAAEIARRRLLCKNVNGVVFSTPLFSRMYPNAIFIGLVRNGLALCESFVRRGKSADEFGRMYDAVCQRMITDSQQFRNYFIVRFEDMISNPTEFVRFIYSRLGLSVEDVNVFKLQAKQSMDRDGSRKYTFGGKKDREIRWFPLERISDYFRKDVNDNQIAQLNQQDRETFLNHAQKSMEYFGYLEAMYAR
jgi:hypothetical protein